MKIIVGLGNPGSKYRDTRHNIGYRVLASIHGQFDSPRPAAKFQSEIVDICVGDRRVLLQSPLTYMNLSGQAVRAAMDFHKLSAEDMLVVCDDFHLSLGRLRIRPSGSAGGQRGLEDIILRLGTQEVSRLRIGIGPPPLDVDPAGWVLGKFTKVEIPQVDESVARAARAALVWVEQGTAAAMNQFNAPPESQTPESPEDAAT